MAREPDELVEMRRVLGAQLAAYRQAAELSQGQLAIAVVIDRTTVAHIEKGRSRADERFWTIADAKCPAEGALRQVPLGVSAGRSSRVQWCLTCHLRDVHG